MTAAGQLPVVTIGGYLGSGKTTLVNHLLRHADGNRLAVLVNEFGELPIDEDLIEARDGDMVSIAGGCICCSFGDDLLGTLADMRGLDLPPDYVVIESSGVAIPGAIVATMLLDDGFRSEGIVVVVDAATVEQAAADDYIGDTILRQLSDADILVVNKLDLVPGERGRGVGEWLGEAAPKAVQIPTSHGKAPFQALVGFPPDPGALPPGGHADGLFRSFVLRPGPAAGPEEVARLLADGSHGVVRAKGHVRDADGATWLVQTVGRQWEARMVEARRDPGMVVIGFRDRLDEAGLRVRMEAVSPASAG